MGLDMYLYGVNYFSKYERDKNGNYIRDKSEIHKTEEIYWRKAYEIHRWFVNNCQYGMDDCMPHEVSEEQLVELKNLCKKVINEPNKAHNLLPTELEYDKYYFDEVNRTMNEINRLLNSNYKYDWYEYCGDW